MQPTTRRVFLRGSMTAAVIGCLAVPAVAAPIDGDAEVAMLAERYRRVTNALVDLITEAERRYGPFAYEDRPAYRGRYDALVALEKRCTEALAQARPASVRGLVLKLRPAFYCDTLYDARPDCDTAMLLPALHDLERLAADAGRAAVSGS